MSVFGSSLASDKKQPLVKLFQVSLLFGYGMAQEGEALFLQVQKQPLNLVCRRMADVIFKCDRALAMGDYHAVEGYCLQMLQQRFPKVDNLSRLVYHYTLGEVYEKLGDREKASYYYRYCVGFVGETTFKVLAAQKLPDLAEFSAK